MKSYIKCRKCRRKAYYIGYGLRYCERCYAGIYGREWD